MSPATFPLLSRPVNIGKLRLDNRLSVAPIVHNLATESGAVTERLIDIYRKKGSGGWALVMVEAAHVSDGYSMFSRMLGIHDDRLIAGLAELAEAIQEGGARAGIQIMHPGGLAPVNINHKEPVAPSSVKMGRTQTKALSISEIELTINNFAAAAKRAKRAGFDLVQIHGAHGFLIHQFLSPYYNKRDDEYGEPAAFAVEVISRVREAVGPNYPLSMRISGEEFLGDGDADLKHMKKMAPLLVKAGLDCLDVSAGSSANSGDWVAQPIYYKHGCIVHLAEAIKKVVDVPVVTAGRINNPRLAEKILSKDQADIISIGRGAFADPGFAKKALSGNHKNIRQCTACYIGCARIDKTGTMCSMNFELGRHQNNYSVAAVPRPKKVMVIGGGLAGMETARVAALRGHEVHLYERGKTLGGLITKMAGVIPHVNTADLMLSVKWLKREMEDSNITIALETEVTPGLVKNENPDVVIMATGSVSELPEIPGLDKTDALTIDDYLVRKKNTGQRVAIIGGQHGSEVALSLARDKKTVTVIEEKKAIALAPYLLTRRHVLIRYIKEAGIEILTRTSLKKINKQGIVVIGPDGNEKTIEVDSVMFAPDRNPDNALEGELKDKGHEIHKVGDCVRPLHTLHAIHSANRVARLI